jgi:hypothetical protein
MVYKNPISESDVKHTSFENKGKACGGIGRFYHKKMVWRDIWTKGL